MLEATRARCCPLPPLFTPALDCCWEATRSDFAMRRSSCLASEAKVEYPVISGMSTSSWKARLTSDIFGIVPGGKPRS